MKRFIADFDLKDSDIKNLMINQKKPLLRCKVCHNYLYGHKLKTHMCSAKYPTDTQKDILEHLYRSKHPRFRQKYISKIIDLKPVVFFRYISPNKYYNMKM